MGYPVAFDARAEERETLGFISITAYSKLLGFKANWTLHPPIIPTSSMILKAEVLSI